MNIQPDLHLDQAAFLVWHQENQGRYELVGGRIVMMAGISRVHMRIARNLVAVLSRRLDPRQWEVCPEFGLDVGPHTLRYPDMVVDRAAGANEDYTATKPVLLAEVLSPSTAAIDLGDKVSEYLQIPSVMAYMVFAQDEYRAWVWNRIAGQFLPEPIVLTGTQAIVRVVVPPVEFLLSDVYAGIEL